jgi:hypothetical protein
MKAPLPDLGDVLYVPPSRDEARHRCGNCRFYTFTGRCSVLNTQVGVPDICGYWLGREPATKELSGFMLVLAGTACDNCRYYVGTAAIGKCLAVTKIGSSAAATVQPRGCCSRWRGRK